MPYNPQCLCSFIGLKQTLQEDDAWPSVEEWVPIPDTVHWGFCPEHTIDHCNVMEDMAFYQIMNKDMQYASRKKDDGHIQKLAV